MYPRRGLLCLAGLMALLYGCGPQHGDLPPPQPFIATENPKTTDVVIIASGVVILTALAWLVATKRSRHHNPRQHLADQPHQPPSAAASGQRAAQRDAQLIERILDIMDNTTAYCDPNFGVTQLTALVGSNISYVPRAVKARLGKSVPQLINEYRIGEACRRMLDKEHYGNYTLQAIAQSVGFKSQNNFIAMFKRVTGVTPSLYLKKMSQTSEPTENNDSGN